MPVLLVSEKMYIQQKYTTVCEKSQELAKKAAKLFHPSSAADGILVKITKKRTSNSVKIVTSPSFREAEKCDIIYC